jgi:hypothetical protein
MSNLSQASIMRPYKWHEPSFPQVLLGVGDDDRFARDRAFENVVRTGNANKCPSFLLKAPNDFAAGFQH